jgi:cyclopropane-fatty-acyl-phospholipid synthase
MIELQQVVRRLAPGSPSPSLDLAVKAARRLEVGRLTLELPDGRHEVVVGSAPGPAGHIRINRARAIRRFFTSGTLGFSEAFVDGDWDSNELPELLELLARNEHQWLGDTSGWSWRRLQARLLHLLRPNDRPGSRSNILAHYDLGNSFFARWLDPGMMYSSARYRSGDEALEAAQRNKLTDMAQLLDLGPGAQLLEIGCGWGGFAEFVAKETGARVTAITISDQQHAYASERIQREGLNDRVEIRLQDYRDVRGSFDAVASIEMFEAVGERYWPLFFGKLRDRLLPSGRAGLQVITIAERHFEDYRRGAPTARRSDLRP